MSASPFASQPTPASSIQNSVGESPFQELARTRLILIASGKGGVGKTWLSITLACLLAQKGRKVLLFDGDLGLANVDIQLGLNNRKDLGTVLEGNCTLKEAIFRYDTGRFDILAGRSGSGALANLSSQRLCLVREGLRILAQDYDHLLIDLGAGIEGPVKVLSDLTALQLVVITDEPTSLTDAYALIKVMRAQNASFSPSIVVNMADSPASGLRTYQTLLKACENFLKFSPPLGTIILRNTKVKDSIRSQIPIPVRFPNAASTHDVERLRDQVLNMSSQNNNVLSK